MAKKKKGKGRGKAPKRHPGSARPPTPPATQDPVPGQTTEAGAEPVADRRAASKERREAQRLRRLKERRRKRTRTYVVVGLVVAVVLGLLGWQVVNNRRQAAEARRLAAAAGCTDVENTGRGDQTHLIEGAPMPDYHTSPPTNGPHWPSTVPAGAYDEPFAETVPTTGQTAPTLVQAVHSHEHGYVVIWHNELADDELDMLVSRFGNEEKVIVVPYPDMPRGQKLAMTSWSFLQHCSEVTERSVEVAANFVERYKEHRSAPERFQR